MEKGSEIPKWICHVKVIFLSNFNFWIQTVGNVNPFHLFSTLGFSDNFIISRRCWVYLDLSSFEYYSAAPRTKEDLDGIKKDLITLSEPISNLLQSWDNLSPTSTVFSEPETTQFGVDSENEDNNRLNQEYEAYEHEVDEPSKSIEQQPSYYPDPGMAYHSTTLCINCCLQVP